MDKIEIEYENLIKGMNVQDKDGNIGVIKKYKDIHNVVVKYKNGCSFHCLVKGCVETTNIDGEDVEIPHYDPLYYIK